MIKYLVNAISKGLAFSKNEARGTLVLAVLIVVVLGLANFASHRIKTNNHISYDSTLLASWVAEVESSYSVKKAPPAKLTYKSTYDHPKPEVAYRSASKPVSVEPEKVIILDINSSSAEELQKVKGIGKVYSQRIVKYRESLGGFSSLSQLSEIYGLNQEVIEKIGTRFTIQTENKSLEINSDSVKTLIKHPYISYDLAWVIINYRKQNGDIDGFEELKKIKAIDDSLLTKLRPYIK